MSQYEWTTILICDADYNMIPAQRIVIGCYGVGQSYIDNSFTDSEWTVDHIKTGLSVAFYSNFDVALNFAKMMHREFGNIDAWAERQVTGQSTPEDQALSDLIHRKRQHECYVDESYFIDRDKYGQARSK